MSTTGRTIGDLGSWAETRFDLFCSKAGVVANKSNRDRTGWDYLLEFAQPNSSTTPPDHHKPEMTARVQVKSRANGKLDAPLKLDNARRFAASPDPCFVVLAAATEGGEPVRFYAKHFWKPEIRRTLKRLRQAESKSKPVHKQTFVISFRTEDDHTDDLIEWMRSIASQDRQAYSAAKQNLNKTLGYEDGNATGTITFSMDEIEAFVDHSIGLIPTINLTSVRIVDRRFGIEAKTPLLDCKPAYAIMQVNPKSCAVEIIDNDDRSHWFDGEYFAPGIPGLPNEIFKARVAAGPINVILTGDGTATVTVNFHSSEVHEISYLSRCVDLHTSLAKGPVEIVLHMDGVCFDGGTTDELKPESVEILHNCGILLRSLWEIAKNAKGPLPRVSLDQIAHGYEEIRHFRDHVVADTLIIGNASLTDTDRNLIIRQYLFSCTLQIGDEKFSVVRVFRKVEKAMDGDNCKLTFTQPLMLHVKVDQLNLTDHQNAMDEVVKRYTKKHRDGVLVLRAEDSASHPYPVVVAAQGVG